MSPKPNKVPRNPPTTAPTIPNKIVAIIPPGVFPGINNLARTPAMRPNTSHATIPIRHPFHDQQAGIKKIKESLQNYLTDIKFDEPTETKGGAEVITGTGKGKKAGVDVVFAVGVFDAGNGQFVGAAFVVDAKMDDYYKETIRGICQTIRRTKDFAN
jgi:hypothetical protein